MGRVGAQGTWGEREPKAWKPETQMEVQEEEMPAENPGKRKCPPPRGTGGRRPLGAGGYQRGFGCGRRKISTRAGGKGRMMNPERGPLSRYGSRRGGRRGMGRCFRDIALK